LKEFTGGDAVPAKFMRKNVFTYRPIGLVITSTNHMPTTDVVDKAIWRRLRIIPWRREFSESEFDLGIRARIVESEAEGILAWAVTGARAYLSQGLDQEPEQVRKATEDTREDQNPLSEFLAMNVVASEDEKHWIFTPLMWDRYTAWCNLDQVPRQFRKGKKELFRLLDNLLPEPRAQGFGDYPQSWRGVYLRSAEEIAREYVAMASASMLEEEEIVALRERVLRYLRPSAVEEKFGLTGEKRFKPKLVS
jgi:hypothetical protein